MTADGKSREDLTREANHVRTKLLRTVEQLDRRRRDMFDLRSQLDRHLKLLALAGGLLVASTVGTVALVGHRMTSAGERRRRSRWKLARQMWKHPERVVRAERRSFFGELSRSILLSLLTGALVMPARKTLALVTGRFRARDILSPTSPAANAATATPAPMR